MGAVVLLYLLYPLLRFGYRRSRELTILLVVALCVLTRNETMLAISPLANLFSCMISFLFGMMLIEEDLLRTERILWTTGVCILLTAGVRAATRSANGSIWLHLAGFTLFLGLYLFAEWIEQAAKPAANLLHLLSERSFEVFLVHHVVIDKVLRRYPAENGLQLVILFVCCILMTAGLTVLLHKAAGKLRRRAACLGRQKMAGGI